MKRVPSTLIRLATTAAGLLPSLALAHPGHGETTSFAAGALHPLGGADHIAGFLIVGLLATQLCGRYLWPMVAVFLGLLVGASTSSGDGWQYAAGFMLSGAALIAAAMAATATATRLLVRRALPTSAPR